jgi:hypothetical protein
LLTGCLPGGAGAAEAAGITATAEAGAVDKAVDRAVDETAAGAAGGIAGETVPGSGNARFVYLEDDGQTALLVNLADGYTVEVPAGMILDVSRGPYGIRMKNRETTVTIYKEPLSRVSRASFINYTLGPIRTGRDPVQLTGDILFESGQWTVRQVEWSRPALPLLEADQPHYISLFVWDKDKGLFYIQIKGADAGRNAGHAARMLSTLERRSPEPSAELKTELPEAMRAGALSAHSGDFLRDYFESDAQTWGFFEPSVPGYMFLLQEIESKLGYSFPFLLTYSNFDAMDFGQNYDFSKQEGRTIQYTFQTLIGNSADDFKRSVVYEILQGRYDGRFRQLAGEIARYGAPVLLRLNNEMNGDWCGYCAYYSSLDPELFEAVWRHIRQIFQDAGADNALWVFNANYRSYPDFLWNHTLWYYPGDAYVDVVGLTAYNTGDYYSGEQWTSFTDLYNSFYWDYINWFPNKPFMISEFACSGYGGDKAAWIRDMMVKMPFYSRIKVMVWWNGFDWDGSVPSRTYALDEASMSAFREGLRFYSKPRLSLGAYGASEKL